MNFCSIEAKTNSEDTEIDLEIAVKIDQFILNFRNVPIIAEASL
jgi:hypothetical protein